MLLVTQRMYSISNSDLYVGKHDDDDVLVGHFVGHYVVKCYRPPQLPLPTAASAIESNRKMMI